MKHLHFILTTLFACIFFFMGCKENPTDTNDPDNPSTQTFLVTFNPNGGEGTMEPQKFIEKKPQELTANTFSHIDSVFTGWNKQADGSGAYYINQQRIVVTSSMDLYAQWANPDGNGQPCQGIPTVKDINGNTYNTVQIGTQCWMRENLKTTQYKTDQDILVISDKNQWIDNYLGAMCYYNNDKSNAALYGALYNGYAVRTGNLCPQGWHIPSDTEWNILAQYLGGANMAGFKMKALYHWVENNANNKSSFTAYPAGVRTGFDEGSFYGMGELAAFWSSTHNAYENSARKLIWYKTALEDSYYSRSIGLSVRCVKD